jgi:hypothetical protein
MTSASPFTWAVLSALMAVVTWLTGWWAVPALAAGWAFLRRPVAAWPAGAAASIGWGAILFSAPGEARELLARRMGGIFGVPGWGMILVTLMFAWLLGWSGARLGRAVRGWNGPTGGRRDGGAGSVRGGALN